MVKEKLLQLDQVPLGLRGGEYLAPLLHLQVFGRVLFLGRRGLQLRFNCKIS